MSRLRPHTVKASLSNDEKKAIAAIAKRHEMSEAELIRFALCNADDLDIDFGFSEIADQKFRTDDIHVRVSPEEKKKIESNADSLDMTVSAYARRVLLKGNVEKIDVDRASIDKIYHELLKEGTNLNQLMYFVNAQGLSAYNEKAVSAHSKRFTKLGVSWIVLSTSLRSAISSAVIKMTVIKQKSISSERYAKNVRKYINGKDAIARGGWNIEWSDRWFSKMDRTRKVFHHDKPSRAGAKNVILLHQILAFLPEECSCNGGKMTPDACLAYAEQWLAKHYPHQQVILALHEESDKAGKRFAVHMAINRTNLDTGKRCDIGGRKGKYERAAWVREMDEAWNLAQLEKGKKNSKIRDRQPRDIEKEIVDRGEYSYKNNLRELIHIAIDEGRVKNMEQFKKLLASWGVDIFIKNNRVYATDLDIKEAGNPKCTFNLTRLDGRFAVKQLEAAFKNNVLEAERALPYERRCEIYIQRLKKAYSAWAEQAKASKGVAYNLFPKFIAPKCDEDLLEDPAVRDELLARRGYAREIRNRYAGAVPDTGDDRVRAAGRAHGGNVDISPQVDRAVDRGDYARGDTPR